MIIHLSNNRFNKFFITESKNSDRAHKQTRVIIAQRLGKAVDDPDVISQEQYFERQMFGEGLRTDWFITLEPYAYNWLLTSSVFGGDAVSMILKYLFTKAQTAENRTAFMQQIKSFQTFTEVRNFVGDSQKADRAYARENGAQTANLNQNYQVLGPLSFEEANQYGNYSGYGGGQSGRICYTQYPNTWKSSDYSNDDTNSCFILLRNDWKEVPTEHDGSERNNGLPEPLNQYDGYDDYGLSMIVLFINPDGELHECNTRWNHEASYAPGRRVDLALTQTDIENLMGAPFETIFNSSNFYERADTIDDRIANGDNIASIFDYAEYLNKSFMLVELNKKYNIFSIEEKRLLFPHDWFKEIGVLNDYQDYVLTYGNDHIFLVGFKDLYNFVDYTELLENRVKNGCKLEELFRYVEPISKYALVYIRPNQMAYSEMKFQRASLYNFETGEFMCYGFDWPYEGVFLNRKDGIKGIKFFYKGEPNKVNFLTDNSGLVLDTNIEEWMDGDYTTFENYGKTVLRVYLQNGKENLITFKDDGNLGFVFDKWFDTILDYDSIMLQKKVKNRFTGYFMDINENMFFEIGDGGKEFYGDLSGNLYMSDAELIEKVNDIIGSGNDMNFGNASILTVHGEKSNFMKVRVNAFEIQKDNVYDIANRRFLFPMFVDGVELVRKDGLFKVIIKDKENLSYLGGEMIYEASFDEWPVMIYASTGGRKLLFTLMWEKMDENNEYSAWYNIMDLNGNLLLKENCRNMTPFIDGICVIEREDEQSNFIDEDLNPLFENWFVYIDFYDFEDEETAFVHCTPNRDNSSRTRHVPTYYSKINHKLITKDDLEQLFDNYLNNGHGHDIALEIANESGNLDEDDLIEDFIKEELMLGGSVYSSVGEEISTWLYRMAKRYIEVLYDDIHGEEEEI